MSVVESICRHVAILDGGKIVETGEVSEIFSHPKSPAAKQLVFPENADESMLHPTNGQHLIRVVFNGAAATSSPLIAHMALEHGITANIVYASTKSIGGRAYGSMILSVDSDDEAKKTVEYLSQTPDVIAQEVSENVQ